MRDLVEDMFLMHLISWMLERSGRDPVTIRAFAEKEKPDLAVGKRETNRELTLPETV